MADPITQVTLRIKRGTSVEWAASPYVLASGEPGYDTTVKRMKVGDGVNQWAVLKWQDVDTATLERIEAAAEAIEGATTPTDGVMTAVAADPGSAFATELSTTFVERSASPVMPVSPNGDAQRGLDVGKLGLILKRGGPGAFDVGKVESPAVWWDDHEQMYCMVYVGYDDPAMHAKVGLAMAPKPEGPWTKVRKVFEGTDVAGDPDMAGTSGPVVYYEDGTYYLWYIGLPEPGYEAGTKRAMIATTTQRPSQWTPASWTRRGVMVAPTGSSGWFGDAIYHAHVEKRPDAYYLFINARGFPHGRENIGFGKAPSMLGPWVLNPTPLVTATNVAGDFDENIVNDPSLYRVGDIWYMAYGGGGGSPLAMKGDGIAWTTDAAFPWGPDGVGTPWRRHPLNPIIRRGADAQAFDAAHAGKPYILATPHRHYHYYSANALDIALAAAPYSWKYENVPLHALGSARSTTSTSFADLAQSEWQFDTRGKPGLQARIVARANSGTDVAEVTVGLGSIFTANPLVISSAGGGYKTVYGDWIDLSGRGDLGAGSNWKMRSVGGASVQLGSAAIEFRWIE